MIRNKHKMLVLTTAAVMLVLTFSAHAEFVKDSYIITFKQPSGTEKPIIDPPNEMNRGKTPVGMNSTGQSKEQLAAQLNLNGEVISILETINAVHVKMSADEAQRLSLDPRVLSVQQDMITTAAIQNNLGEAKEDIPADEHPTYQNGILTIPRIDTADQSGKFQDVKLSLTAQGDWHLVDVKIPLDGPYVDTVQTVVTDTFPFQVFLKVNGFFTDGCTSLGQIDQRVKAKRFEVVMYAQTDAKPGYVCSANVPTFEKIIPLPVYGLNAGTYEYSLGGVLTFNGEKPGSSPKTFTGTFNIPRDNKL